MKIEYFDRDSCNSEEVMAKKKIKIRTIFKDNHIILFNFTRGSMLVTLCLTQSDNITEPNMYVLILDMSSTVCFVKMEISYNQLNEFIINTINKIFNVLS